MDEQSTKELMQGLYQIIKIGGIIFGAGMAYQLLKVLKENLAELKSSHTTLTQIVSGHETRITILENGKKR